MDLYQRHNLANMEGRQQWGFSVQDTGISWRLPQRHRSSQRERRHRGAAYIAQLTCKDCAERQFHASCSLVLMDSMRQARLDFTLSWQCMDIPKTVLEFMFSTETCATVSTLLWLHVKADFRIAGMPTFSAGMWLWPSLFQRIISHQVLFGKTCERVKE